MLKLYIKNTCPFCHRVMQMADNMGIELEIRDVSENEEFLEELLSIGKKKQVPFLVDDDKNTSMYESSDIIDYLRDNYLNKGSSEKTSDKPNVHVGGSVCESCEG